MTINKTTNGKEVIIGVSGRIDSKTAPEFESQVKECFAEAMFAPESNEGVKVKKHYVYGLQGLCDLFDYMICSDFRNVTV